jgi:hypothetical protein
MIPDDLNPKNLKIITWNMLIVMMIKTNEESNFGHTKQCFN